MQHSDLSDSDNRNISHAAGVVGYFAFFSRILGLVRDMVLASFFGTGMVADAFEMAGAVLCLLALILAVVILPGIVCAPWIVRLQAFGFGSARAKYELTVLLTRIMFPYIFFIVCLLIPWVLKEGMNLFPHLSGGCQDPRVHRADINQGDGLSFFKTMRTGFTRIRTLYC